MNKCPRCGAEGSSIGWQCGSSQVEGGEFIDTMLCNLWESRNQTAEVAAVLRKLVMALQAPVDWLQVRAILVRAKSLSTFSSDR